MINLIDLVNEKYYLVKFISDETIEIAQYLCDGEKGFYFCGDEACYKISHFKVMKEVIADESCE